MPAKKLTPRRATKPSIPRKSKAVNTLDAKLRQFVAQAYRNSPATKARFDAAGLKPAQLKRVADLEKLPILRKDDLVRMQQAQPPFGGLVSTKALQNIHHIYLSPGPLFEPDSGESEGLKRGAAVVKDLGFGRGDIVLNTLSYHLVPAGMIVDATLVAAGCTVAPGGVGQSELQVKMLVDLQITGYAGTPSFLMTILRKAEELGIRREQLALKKALFLAEPYPPSLRQVFEGEYGMRTADSYTTAELGFIGYDDGKGPGWRLAAGLIVEIVDPLTGKRVSDGEQGEIVVTRFSPNYPLIRFGTGDLSAFIGPQRLAGWLGRAGEAVKVRGMFVHPNQLKQAAAKFPTISRIQGVVTRPDNVRDYFVVRVEAGDTRIGDALMETVQGLCRVKLDEVQFVPAGVIPDGARGMVDERKWE